MPWPLSYPIVWIIPDATRGGGLRRCQNNILTISQPKIPFSEFNNSILRFSRKVYLRFCLKLNYCNYTHSDLQYLNNFSGKNSLGELCIKGYFNVIHDPIYKITIKTCGVGPMVMKRGFVSNPIECVPTFC